MARKKGRRPMLGDAYAVPLEDGRYAVCRVISASGNEGGGTAQRAPVLVVGSAWIGNEIPCNPRDPLNHHVHEARPER